MTPSGSIPSGPAWSRSLELHFGGRRKKNNVKFNFEYTTHAKQPNATWGTNPAAVLRLAGSQTPPCALHSRTISAEGRKDGAFTLVHPPPKYGCV